MGMRTYFQKVNGHDDVSINNAIARRATLKEKKSGGTRIHSFPFRTCFSQDMKFIDAIYAIRDKQNEYFRHANYDPTAYFAYRAKTYPQPHAGLTYEPISLTYQPLTLKEKGLDQLGDIRYTTKWYPNGMTPQAVYLTVMHRPEDNGLDFNFEHQVKAFSREELETIQTLAFRVNEVLKAYFLGLGMTLVDFKLEFGRLSDGSIVLADEISPDTCRLWDSKTHEKLDKDRFRRDLGGVEEAYQEVMRRLMGE